MIDYVLHRDGQSIYDLCLQAYSTLDHLVKFCNDNGVADMHNIPQRVQYQFDTTLVKYEGNTKEFVTEAETGYQAYGTEEEDYYYGTESGDAIYIWQA